MPWGCFVEMPVERGIAIALGMAAGGRAAARSGRVRRRGRGGYAAWAHLAAEALGGFQALYVHLKGPDVPAHDGRAEDKRDVIAAIDRAFFGEVLAADRPRGHGRRGHGRPRHLVRPEGAHGRPGAALVVAAGRSRPTGRRVRRACLRRRVAGRAPRPADPAAPRSTCSAAELTRKRRVRIPPRSSPGPIDSAGPNRVTESFERASIRAVSASDTRYRARRRKDRHWNGGTSPSARASSKKDSQTECPGAESQEHRPLSLATLLARFRKDRWASPGVIIVVMIALAVLAPLVGKWTGHDPNFVEPRRARLLRAAGRPCVAALRDGRPAPRSPSKRPGLGHERGCFLFGLLRASTAPARPLRPDPVRGPDLPVVALAATVIAIVLGVVSACIAGSSGARPTP